MSTIAQKLHEKGIITVSGIVGIETSDYKVTPNILATPPKLEIFQESYGEESVFYPAQHLCIYGKYQLEPLYEFIGKLLGKDKHEPAANAKV